MIAVVTIGGGQKSMRDSSGNSKGNLEAEFQIKSPSKGDGERRITQQEALGGEPTNVAFVLLLIAWFFKTTVGNLLLLCVA